MADWLCRAHIKQCDTLRHTSLPRILLRLLHAYAVPGCHVAIVLQLTGKHLTRHTSIGSAIEPIEPLLASDLV